jgi:UDP-N-acetylmuramyl pentapeptide synthase
VVVHAYNPSYSEGRDGKIVFQGQPWGKLARYDLKNKPSMVVNTCGHSYSGGRIRRIAVTGQLGKVSTKPCLRNKLKAKDWVVAQSSMRP